MTPSAIKVFLFHLLPLVGTRGGARPVDARTTLGAVLADEGGVELSLELLELVQVGGCHRLPCCLQGLLEMLPCNLGNGIEALSLSSLLHQSLHPNIGFNGLNKSTLTSLMAAFAAFWQISVRSAPENPSVIWAIKLRSMSLEIGVFLRLAFKTPNLEGWSGRGMQISWSSLPGLMMASSRISGLLVAPMKKTFFLTPVPSISVKRAVMTLSPAPPASPPPPPPLATAIESSSSKKRTQGEAAFALSNTSLTLASDSPNHMVNNCGPLMEIKLALHSLATALAIRVFPQPGGPQKRTPFDGCIPNFMNFSGCSIGKRIISCNCFFTSSRPPMSSHLTSGIST